MRCLGFLDHQFCIDDYEWFYDKELNDFLNLIKQDIGIDVTSCDVIGAGDVAFVHYSFYRKDNQRLLEYFKDKNFRIERIKRYEKGKLIEVVKCHKFVDLTKKYESYPFTPQLS